MCLTTWTTIGKTIRCVEKKEVFAMSMRKDRLKRRRSTLPPGVVDYRDISDNSSSSSGFNISSKSKGYHVECGEGDHDEKSKEQTKKRRRCDSLGDHENMAPNEAIKVFEKGSKSRVKLVSDEDEDAKSLQELDDAEKLLKKGALCSASPGHARRSSSRSSSAKTELAAITESEGEDETKENEGTDNNSDNDEVDSDDKFSTAPSSLRNGKSADTDSIISLSSSGHSSKKRRKKCDPDNESDNDEQLSTTAQKRTRSHASSKNDTKTINNDKNIFDSDESEEVPLMYSNTPKVANRTSTRSAKKSNRTTVDISDDSSRPVSPLPDSDLESSTSNLRSNPKRAVKTDPKPSCSKASPAKSDRGYRASSSGFDLNDSRSGKLSSLYSRDEDKAILRYIYKRLQIEPTLNPNEAKFWEELVAQKVCPNRTAGSMKNRFLVNIIKTIETYHVKLCKIPLILDALGVSHAHRGKIMDKVKRANEEQAYENERIDRMLRAKGYVRDEEELSG